MIQERVCIEDTCYFRIKTIEVIIETGTHILSSLVLVAYASLERVAVTRFPFQPEVCVPFILIKTSEISHGLLPVQFEELQRSLLMDVHDLPSVRFVTTCLSV